MFLCVKCCQSTTNVLTTHCRLDEAILSKRLCWQFHAIHVRFPTLNKNNVLDLISWEVSV